MRFTNFFCNIAICALLMAPLPALAATFIFEAPGTYTYDFASDDLYYGYYGYAPGEADEHWTLTGTIILELEGEDWNQDKILSADPVISATPEREMTRFAIRFKTEEGAVHTLMQGFPGDGNHSVGGHFDFATRDLAIRYQFLNVSGDCGAEYGAASGERARYERWCVEGLLTTSVHAASVFRQVSGPPMFIGAVPLPASGGLALLGGAVLGGVAFRNRQRIRR